MFVSLMLYIKVNNTSVLYAWHIDVQAVEEDMMYCQEPGHKHVGFFGPPGR